MGNLQREAKRSASAFNPYGLSLENIARRCAIGQNVQNSWLCPDHQWVGGQAVLGSWQPRVHWAGGSVDSQASSLLLGSDWLDIKAASGSQSAFDAAWANTSAASWYSGLASLSVPSGAPSWQSFLRSVVQRVTL